MCNNKIKEDKYICQYCHREFKNKNSLVQHEKTCKSNPNRIARTIRQKYDMMANEELLTEVKKYPTRKEAPSQLVSVVRERNIYTWGRHYGKFHIFSDSELLEIIQKYKNKKEIINNGDANILVEFKRRNLRLPDHLFYNKMHRYEDTLSDEELLKLVEDIPNRDKAKANTKLYILKLLKERNILPERFLKHAGRSKAFYMSDTELINSVSKFSSKNEAIKNGMKSYINQIEKRKIICPNFQKTRYRSCHTWTDDEIIKKLTPYKTFKNAIENGCQTYISEAQKRGLDIPCRTRYYHPEYSNMSNDELIDEAKNVFKDANIRRGNKINRSLINNLRKRKLLYEVFPDTKNKEKVIKNKLSLLNSSDLEYMSDHQLIELIGQDVLPKEFKILINSKGGSKKRKDDIKKLRDKILSNNNIVEENIENNIKQIEQEERTTSVIEEDNINNYSVLSNDSLPVLTTQELQIYDKYFVSHGEKNEYITKESINKIWNNVLSNITYLDTILELRKTSSEWLSYVIDTFLDEYKTVTNLTINNDDYKFEYQPSLMQKLMAYRIANNPYYGNWCGTGAGKTNAFLIASRTINAKVTICICPNSVIDTIKNAIINCYPNNSNIIIVKSLEDIKQYNINQFNYILFNYEKFSQYYAPEMIEKLIDLNTIDFICFDEVHRTKNNDSIINQNLTNLRTLAFKKNNKLKVLGMTATPLINTINEVKNLLELISETSFKDFIKDNSTTLNNIHNAYKYLTLYGFRYVPNYNINCKEEIIKIIADKQLAEKLVSFKNNNVNDIESSFIPYKYNAIRQYITNKTIIYTQFIKKLIPKIKKCLKDDGITFKEYTGEISSEERNQIITDFSQHKFDIILASAPISTGVDGLQKYCDNIIIMSMPWTNAEYTQLIGRINRQGSNFKSVSIIIPQVFIPLDDDKHTLWSWDEKRYNIVKTKKTLSDAVVDGVFTSVFNINRKKLLNEAIQKLKEGITDFTVKREFIEPIMVVKDNSIDIKDEIEYKDSIINNIHRKANTSSSKHMHEYFKQNPNMWKEYHMEREENKKSWNEDPLNVIADRLNNENFICTKNKVIADLGCGTNKLKTLVNYYKQWYSFDHIAIDGNKDIIEADISNLKDYLEDNSIDIAIFCMSLWGTNYMEYIKEAYRYIRPNGLMFIVEPKDKVNQAELIGMTTQYGFNLKTFNPERCGKTYLEFEKQ